MPDILVGGGRPFRVVSIEQPFWRLSSQHQRQLPHQVVDILDPAVGAARAERRNQMRRIADKKRAPVAKRAHPSTLERVHARPLDVEISFVTEHGAKARQNILRLLFFFRAGSPAQLKSDAPTLTWLTMQPRSLT